MNILGLVTRTHDSGLALLVDGIPILVLEEERFNREKHTQRFPVRSLEHAFKAVPVGEIDVITIPWSMPHLRRTLASALLGQLPASLHLLSPNARPTQSSFVINIPMQLRYGLWRHFGMATKLPPIVQVRHHDAHAAMFFVSPFEEAATLVMDGYGDETAQSAYNGRGNSLTRLWQSDFFDSLGMLYTAVSTHLGFKTFEEGTVMALAATGGPTFVQRFRELLRLGPDGRFSVNRDYISYDTHGLTKPFKQRFIDAFGIPRGRAQPVEDQHRDLAFALQATIEETIVHVVRDLARRTASRNLCLIGGVALNCVANARILRDTDFKSVWVPPCASDSGAPLGSALWHYHQTLGHQRNFALTHAFYGKGYTEDEISAALDQAGLNYRRLEDDALFQRIARDLANGMIVGWFQGRAEVGPRALGNRSILADARDPAMKDRINRLVKHREAFRPFAPAVLEERLSDYFEIEHTDPFMTFAPRVRPDKLNVIPAGVHVDGTARIQTVNRQTNPRFYRLIETFFELTGVPVLLNTSLNFQEPIAQSPNDAIACYVRTAMDMLVLGNFYIDRKETSNERAREPTSAIAAE